MHKAAQCFVGTIEGKMVAFESVIHFPHPRKRNIKRGHRLVILPDYQGIGLGGILINFVADYYKSRGFDFYTTQSQPALIKTQERDAKWRLISFSRNKRVGKTSPFKHLDKSISSRRLTASFRWVGEHQKTLASPERGTV
jgi:GNAT superfamily N-acetyltransferase